MEQHIQVKVYFGHESIRRIKIQKSSTFESLVQTLKSHHEWVDLTNPNIKLYYEDEEEDKVAFSSDSEWQTALELSSYLNQPMRLYVTKGALVADRVASFVKSFDFKGLWGSVLDNVSSIRPVVQSLASGMCQPQSFDEEEQEPPKVETIVEEKDVERPSAAPISPNMPHLTPKTPEDNPAPAFETQSRFYKEGLESFYFSSVKDPYPDGYQQYSSDSSEDDDEDEESEDEESGDEESGDEESEDEESETYERELSLAQAVCLTQIEEMGFSRSREELIDICDKHQYDMEKIANELLNSE